MDSPKNVARLLLELRQGKLLDPDNTALALQLMGTVVESQIWGIAAGLENDAHTRLYLKNGWYPEEDGWCVNTAGVIVPPRNPDYFLVVLSCEQPSFEDGLQIAEKTAAILNESLARAP
jgi:hypothetical protein